MFLKMYTVDNVYSRTYNFRFNSKGSFRIKLFQMYIAMYIAGIKVSLLAIDFRLKLD